MKINVNGIVRDMTAEEIAQNKMLLIAKLEKIHKMLKILQKQI